VRGNASKYPDKRISVAGATAQFETWLASASPEMIGRATVDQLEARYRIDRRYLECKLSARQEQIRRDAMVAPI
jgi:hypothetical protein